MSKTGTKRKRARKFTPIPKKKRLKKDNSGELLNNVKRRGKKTATGENKNESQKKRSRKSSSISSKNSLQNKSKQKNYRSISPALAIDTKFEITDYDTVLFKKVQQSAENSLASNTMTPLKTQSPNSKVKLN